MKRYTLSVSHYFYLARCNDHSLYAGTCIDPVEREQKHNDGTGAKYTRGRGPVRIIYIETFETLSEARTREAEVKRMTKKQKEHLLHSSHEGRISPPFDRLPPPPLGYGRAGRAGS